MATREGRAGTPSGAELRRGPRSRTAGTERCREDSACQTWHGSAVGTEVQAGDRGGSHALGPNDRRDGSVAARATLDDAAKHHERSAESGQEHPTGEDLEAVVGGRWHRRGERLRPDGRWGASSRAGLINVHEHASGPRSGPHVCAAGGAGSGTERWIHALDDRRGPDGPAE